VCIWALSACIASGCNHATKSPLTPADVEALVESTHWTVTGAVTEAGGQLPVPDTRIEALDGPNMGMFATADAQGRYTLSALQPGTFSIRAAADGLEPESRSVALASSQTVDFTLRRAVTAGPDLPPARWALTGLVRDAGTHASLASVRVEILDGNNQGQAAATDGQGRYGFGALDQGTFSIRAAADQFESEMRGVTLTSNTSSRAPLVAVNRLPSTMVMAPMLPAKSS